MIPNGAVVRFVGNAVAKQRAINYNVDEWYPDAIVTGSLGICEGLDHIDDQEYYIYKCRFVHRHVVDDNILHHIYGNFFFFEIEVV